MAQGPQRIHTSHAPLLGQPNHELPGEPGLIEDEIAGLSADSVIGNSPG